MPSPSSDSSPSAADCSQPDPRADVILIVDTTSDAIANDAACSLREAITAANSNANDFGCLGNGGGFDLIEFSLGGGTPVIHIASNLPAITGPVEINGAPNRVELRGPGGGTGLRISGAGAAGSSVRNLVVTNFDTAVFAETTSNVSIVGSCIGTNASGSAPFANATGILLSGTRAQIGGTNGWTFGSFCVGGSAPIRPAEGRFRWPCRSPHRVCCSGRRGLAHRRGGTNEAARRERWLRREPWRFASSRPRLGPRSWAWTRAWRSTRGRGRRSVKRSTAIGCWSSAASHGRVEISSRWPAALAD